MIEVPAILYYLLILVVRLYALLYCIFDFTKEKNQIHSEIKIQNSQTSKSSKPRRKFEKEIADCFSQRGWKYTLGPGKIDDGKDIVIGKNGKIFLIQCKHRFGNWMIQSQHIREFDGSINYYNKTHNKQAKGIFITTGITSRRARDTANTLGIQLRDINNWRTKINTFEG